MAAIETRSSEAFARALAADGPAAANAEELALFGRLVGEWELTWTGFDDEGREQMSAEGEWIFAWVLEGRAVQDVWIVPRRMSRSDDGRECEYGTTIRAYDPAPGRGS